MPELPEVEITARRLHDALAGTRIESAVSPGINTLRTFDPPLDALADGTLEAIRRRGKLLIVDVAGTGHGQLHVLMHLMSAGRLGLFDKRATPRDKTARVLLRLPDGRELRLREFGSQQSAWVRVLTTDGLDQDEMLAGLGPEAWPEPPSPAELRKLLAEPRPLHSALRDQHVIAGIGRTWVDEILHTAKLSPFKRGKDLTGREASMLRTAIVSVLDRAITFYEASVVIPIPDKLDKPVEIHGQQGEPCPRCSTVLEAVFYEDHVMTYCPHCQTDDRILKDRRLSRLLK